jgi:DNA-binding transcriptional regulator LsrR (DeoR family)
MDRTLEQLLMAYKHRVEDIPYEDIAHAHGVSVATVSRRISEAERLGYVQTRPRIVPPEGYQDRVRQYATYGKIADRLLQKLERSAGVRRVIVCSGDKPHREKEQPDSAGNNYPRLRRVALHGALRMLEQLKRLDEERVSEQERERREKPRRVRIGVNWGWTMLRLSEQFRAHADEDIKGMGRVSVSGLSGLFWSSSEKRPDLARRSWESSSSACAENLYRAFSEGEDSYVHRIRVPAFLNSDLLSMFVKDAKTKKPVLESFMQEFCRSDPGYCSVYGNKPIFPTTAEARRFARERWESYDQMAEGDHQNKYGNILRYDLLVTGMSALQSDASLLTYVSQFEPSIKRILKEDKSLCGDIAGHMFTNDGILPRLHDADHGKAGMVNSLALALWPEDLIQVADRHRNAPFGGTMVVCAGENKAEALRVALTKLRVANEIVIDTNLAWALYEQLDLTDEERAEDFAPLSVLEGAQ